MAYNLAQKVLGSAKTAITDMGNVLTSIDTLSLCNIHATDTVTVDLYVTSQVGTDIVDTGINVNNGSGYAVTTSSQAIVVDGGTFTDATCDYNNDPTIAHDDDDGKITANSLVSGTGIPAGAYVSSVTSDTAFELSASTTGGSVTNGTLSFILASDDVFLNEQVWKSDGTLFGTCTAVGGSAGMTFSGGIASAMVDDDDLYVGTRYHILKSYVLPTNTTLVLEKNELRVDPDTYTMYIELSASDSAVDVITRK